MKNLIWSHSNINHFMKDISSVQQNTLLFFFLVTLETRSRALVANDRVLDETWLPAIGGNHHSLSCLGLDGQGCLAVSLNQGVYREALGLHRDPLAVHLHLVLKIRDYYSLMHHWKVDLLFWCTVLWKRYFTQENELNLLSWLKFCWDVRCCM